MSLSRFQIPAKRPAPEEEELESAKNLREVIRFAGAGTFYIGAIVADLQYQVYDVGTSFPLFSFHLFLAH